MDDWNYFVNGEGYDMFEPVVSLSRTGPFDTWTHCLVCHQTEHAESQRQRHHWFACETGAPPALHPIEENLDWARDIPQTGETVPLRVLIDIIGSRYIHEIEFATHVRNRDALYLRIHQAMLDRFMEPEWEPWTEAMSAFSVLTKTFLIRLLARPSLILRDAMGNHMLDAHEEDELEFLERVVTAEDEVVPLVEFEVPMQRTEITLRELQNDFDYFWINWEQQVETFLDSNPLMLAFGPTNALWMRKAFNVMLRTQPKLETHAGHVAYFTFPDVEQVARDEGLDV